MGHSEKILILLVFITALVTGQALDSSISSDVDEVTTPIPVEPVGTMSHHNMDSLSTSPLPLGSTDEIMNSVRVLDFVRLTEEKHEAEFILDLIQEFPQHLNKTMTDSGLLDSKLLKFREITTLQDNTLPGKTGLRKVRKVKATVPCKMFYSLYPYDLAVCTFVLFPGGGPTGTWGTSSMSVPSHASLCPGGMEAYEFHVKSYQSLVIPGGNTTGIDVLTLSLLVQRTSGNQVFSQMYSPVLTLVLISFFTMNRGSFVFRIWVSTACLLCMILTTAICWMYIPRVNDGQSATEHYFVFCIGFTFQVVFTNIFMYRYLLNGDDDKTKNDSDVEADPDSKQMTISNGNNENGIAKVNGTADKKLAKLKIKPNEMHILKMGKWHQWVYFKCLRPASWQLPLWFLIFNLIFWPIVIFLSSITPDGFMAVPEPKNELDALCLQ